jgi:hypothetical protein
MFRTILTAALASSAFAAAPALAQNAHAGGGMGLGVGGPAGGMGLGANANMGGGPAGAALDARMNSMGSMNASPTGIMHANPNSALDVDATTGTRIHGRANSQGLLHASPTGVAHANANSVLKGNTVVSGPLAGLAAGMTVQFNGSAFGTVSRIATSSDGTVRRVMVTGTNGKLYSLSPSTLTLSGGILTATKVRG